MLEEEIKEEMTESEKAWFSYCVVAIKEKALKQLREDVILKPYDFFEIDRELERAETYTKGKSFFYDKKIDKNALMTLANVFMKIKVEAFAHNAFTLIDKYARVSNSTIMNVVKSIYEEEDKNNYDRIEIGFGYKKIMLFDNTYGRSNTVFSRKLLTLTEAMEMSGCQFQSLEEAEKNKMKEEKQC